MCGWLEVVPPSTGDARDEDGERFDVRTTFRVLVRRDDGANGGEGEGALRYGFEHIKSGLLLQRRQRGMQKLVFCSNKFGVNEQFDCHSVGDGVLRLVNRRCRGMWDVRVCALETESELVEREATTRAKWSLAEDSVIHKGFGHMRKLISTFKRVQVGHVTEMNHMQDVIKSLSLRRIIKSYCLGFSSRGKNARSSQRFTTRCCEKQAFSMANASS